jgi:hypothetical protein
MYGQTKSVRRFGKAPSKCHLRPGHTAIEKKRNIARHKHATSSIPITPPKHSIGRPCAGFREVAEKRSSTWHSAIPTSTKTGT